jgi:hypothetical protein
VDRGEPYRASGYWRKGHRWRVFTGDMGNRRQKAAALPAASAGGNLSLESRARASVRFQKEMRSISPEIPEPNATRYQKRYDQIQHHG